MVYTPFDFNEAIGHRKEYVEDRLREGSPVVGLSFAGGLLLLTVRRTQRKVFEIYDRMIFAGIGNQSDVESIRVAAIDVAHREGYERSPDDVTAQRLIGFALSPPLKRLFGDQFNAPAVVRGLFAEIGDIPERDAFYTLNYDGDFSQSAGAAAIAGTPEAEERMLALLQEGETPSDLPAAAKRALRAWIAGSRVRRGARHLTDDESEDEEGAEGPARDDKTILDGALEHGTIEAGLLDRTTDRSSKFRLLTPDETAAARAEIG